jgi:hypothetical protein
MNYTIYKQTTGQISRIVQTNEIELQLQEGESYIEGLYNDLTYYIANSEPVEISEKPSAYSEFNFTTKQWELNLELAKEEVLPKRRQLLAASDWTDTLSAKTRLGEQLYNQWQAYRQQLRDITAQSGYPTNVVWPTQPGSTPTT